MDDTIRDVIKFILACLLGILALVAVVALADFHFRFAPQLEAVKRDLPKVGCSEDAVGHGIQINRELASFQAVGIGRGTAPIHIPDCP